MDWRRSQGGGAIASSERRCRYPIMPETPTLLSLWSQTAPRDYVSFALCFPFDESLTDHARKHLLGSLNRLAIYRPEFAGQLQLEETITGGEEEKGRVMGGSSTGTGGGGENANTTRTNNNTNKGRLCWAPRTSKRIPSSWEDISAEFEYTYDELREREFPPGAFCHNRFRLGINPNPPNPPDGTQLEPRQQQQKQGQQRAEQKQKKNQQQQNEPGGWAKLHKSGSGRNSSSNSSSTTASISSANGSNTTTPISTCRRTAAQDSSNRDNGDDDDDNDITDGAALPSSLRLNPGEVPVAIVRAFVVRGGLILSIHLHHGFGDGDCMRVFLECFASETKRSHIPRPDRSSLELPDFVLQRANVGTGGGTSTSTRTSASAPASATANASSRSLSIRPKPVVRSRATATTKPTTEDLVARCPEYMYCPGQQVGPTQPVPRPGGVPLSSIESAGKIFVFTETRLKELRETLRPLPSVTQPPPPSPQPRRGREQYKKTLPTKQEQPRMPTNYVSLAALTWSHVTLARTVVEGDPLGFCSAGGGDEEATISNPVNWKARIICDCKKGQAAPRVAETCIVDNDDDRNNNNPCKEEMDGYFGNATAKCLTRVPTRWLLTASAGHGFLSSSDPSPSSSCPSPYSSLSSSFMSSSSPSPEGVGASGGRWEREILATDALRAVASRITQSIASVNADFVATRTALYASLRDPRDLGLNDDPRVTYDMPFNTWRSFGADIEFCIPGVGRAAVAADGIGGGNSRETGSSPPALVPEPAPTKPDAIRKVMPSGRFDLRNALILPGRRESDIELLVCLPRESLEMLCSLNGWMRWVDRVIG